MSFEAALSKLSALDGLQGAVIVNFETHEMLAKTGFENVPDLSGVVDGLSNLMSLINKKILSDLECNDLFDNMLTSSKNYNQLLYMVPYFDNVILYAVVDRSSLIATSIYAVKEAIDYMT